MKEDQTDNDVGEHDHPSDEVASPRARYQRTYAGLEALARAHAAQLGNATELEALCFDSSPRVIKAILRSPNCTHKHARLIARHHRSSVGLGFLSRSAQYLRDPEVQRQLLRNSHTTNAILKRILGKKPLQKIYQTAIDRSLPQRNRSLVQKLLRRQFVQVKGDQKVALIVRTQGRCLSLLRGVPLDSRTAAMLTRRSSIGHMLVRNLARWSSTPPQVLRHLWRLGTVRSNQSLKNLLMRHPNFPTRLKRRG